jgi:hypothetical protein
LKYRRNREAARLQLFDAGAAALRTAYYSLSDGERAALIADRFGAHAACNLWDRFDCREQWTLLGTEMAGVISGSLLRIGLAPLQAARDAAFSHRGSA